MPDPNMLTRTASVRSIDEAKRAVTFVASTDAVDVYDSVVEQDWETRLGRYRANPVVLWAHNLDADDLPIGRALSVGVEAGELVAVVEFAGAEISALAERAFQAVRQGFLRGMSVGFVPHAHRWEERAGRDVLVLSDNELLELSVCPVPANPEALARSLSAATLADRFPRALAKAATPTNEVTPMTEEEKKRLAALEALMRRYNVTTPEELDAALAAETRAAGRAKELEAQVAAGAQSAEKVERASLIAAARRDGRISKADAEDAEYQKELEGYTLPQLRAHLSRLTPRASAQRTVKPAAAVPTRAATVARAADAHVAGVFGIDPAKMTALRVAKAEEARLARAERARGDAPDEPDDEDDAGADDPAETED